MVRRTRDGITCIAPGGRRLLAVSDRHLDGRFDLPPTDLAPATADGFGATPSSIVVAVASEPDAYKLNASERRVLIQCAISFVALAATQRLISIIWPSHGTVSGWAVPVVIFGGVFFSTRWMMNMSRRINAAGDPQPDAGANGPETPRSSRSHRHGQAETHHLTPASWGAPDPSQRQVLALASVESRSVRPPRVRRQSL